MSLVGFNGWATVGGQNVLTSGLASSTLVQDSHPLATIAVFLSGTTTLATIYADQNGTPLSNPFTADADGYWIFWAASGVLLDVEMSGGVPPFPAAFTLVALPGNNFGSGRAGAGGGPIPINLLLNATGPNLITNGNNFQSWQWQLTGTAETTGLEIRESAPSTAPNTSALVDIFSLVGSTIKPFRAIAVADLSVSNSGIGLQIMPNGDIASVGGAIFIGPVRIPSLINQPVLGTDPLGNVIPGSGGGGPGVATIAVPVSFIAAGSQVVSHGLGTTNPVYSVLSFGGATTWTVAPVDANSVRVTVPSAANLVVSFVFVPPVATLPPVLQSLTLSPTSVQGGVANSTGTVTFTGTVTAVGGFLVTLTSSNPAAASVPASVTVFGSASATFPVTTSVVAANTTVTITAHDAGSGGTQTATLTVTAAVVTTPVYGGVGVAGATATPITLSGTNVTLSNGDVIPQIKASAEAVGDQWTFNPSGAAGQVIYLLLTGATRTFVDASSGLGFAFNPPITVSLSGRTMYLYQTQFALIGSYTVRVSG